MNVQKDTFNYVCQGKEWMDSVNVAERLIEEKFPMGANSGFETWSQGLNLEQLATHYGSPLYLIHLGQLENNLSCLSLFPGTPKGIAYPVKANPSSTILKALAERGASADCASSFEVNLALSAGFTIDRIIFNSPAPDRELMVELLSAGATVVADSADILEFVSSRWIFMVGKGQALSGHAGRLMVRVNLSIGMTYDQETAWQDVVAHASLKGKFGIPEEDLADLLRTLSVPIHGLHLHVGTQMDSLPTFVAAIRRMHKLADELRLETGHSLSMINLGGGLGIPFQDGQVFPSLQEYVETLQREARPDFQYTLEPGHALVGNAVALITRVIELKQVRNRRWAICDVGSDQLIKVTLLGWRHRILYKGLKPLPLDGDDSVGGPLCFAGDTLLPNTDLSGVERGDLLLIQHTGAYCAAVANHFNGRMGPAEVVIARDGQHVLSCHAEDGFFSHTVAGQTLEVLSEESSSQSIPLEEVELLRSHYLRDELKDDTYEILDVRNYQEFIEFKVQVRSPLGLLSLPLAVRLIADLAIVVILKKLGTQVKEVSVWGTRLNLNSETMIRTSSPLLFRFRISEDEIVAGPRHQYTVYFDINRGRFSGSVRAIL